MTAISDFPKVILTDKAGESQRLKVDPGQTGFFAGRMFRSYIERVIPIGGPSVQFRFTSIVDFILWQQRLILTQGALSLRVFRDAVTSGTWVAEQVIGVNRMAERPSPAYTPKATFETGGNFTGGVEVDLFMIRSATGGLLASAAQSSGDTTSERGLPAGVYHGRIATLTGGVAVGDAAQAIYSLQWEERV